MNLNIIGNVNIGTSTSFEGGEYIHTITGNISNSGNINGNTGTFILNGPNASLSGTGNYNFHHLTITANGYRASSNTNISVSGNYSTSGTGTFTHISGGSGSFSMTGTDKSISGTGSVFNNFVSSGSIASSANFTVAGNITISGGSFSSSGATTMTGSNKTITNNGTSSFGTLIINTSATVTTASSFSISSLLDAKGSLTATAGTITFTNTSSFSGTANLHNVNINGTAFQLSSNAILGIANSFTKTAGIFNSNNSIPNTVNYNGTGAQTVLSETYHNLTISNGGTKSAGGNVTVYGTFTIASATTFEPSTYTIDLKANYANYGTFTPSTSTLQFSGTSNSTFYETTPTTFHIITINKGNIANNVTLLSNAKVNTLNMQRGRLLTGVNNITIYNTRTGNAFILGNIWRSHSFTTNTNYAFEGPNNTISFNDVDGVSLIKVKVELSPASDFPLGSSINRLYTIDVPSGSYSANLKLHYEDGELNGNTEGSLNIYAYDGTWNEVLKAGQNTTDNYVIVEDITNLSTRWTLSAISFAVNWTGAVSSDWDDPDNWAVAAGTPNMPPAITDIVQIGIINFTHQPTITSDAYAKSISLGSSKATTITLDSGGTLTTNAISGQWTSNANHTISVQDGILTINNNITLSDGTANRTINLTIDNGRVDIAGSLSQLGGANIIFTGNGILKIGNDYNYTSGTFTAGTGTVEYNGSNGQNVAILPYYNLQIDKAEGNAEISSSITISNDLIVKSGELNVNNDLTVEGDVIINDEGTLVANGGYSYYVKGDWTNTGTFLPGSSTIILNGTDSQTISSSIFNQLVVDKITGTTYLTGDISTNGDFTLENGIVDCLTYNIARTTDGGTLTLKAGTYIKIGGSNNVYRHYTTYNISPSSTVEFYGNVAQSIPSRNYGNLILSNGGSNAKTAIGSFSVAGDFTINEGAQYNADNYTLDLYGNFANNGTFNAQTGLIIFNGTNKTISGTTTFFDTEFTGSYSVSENSNITYLGQISIISGASVNTGNSTITISGDMLTHGTIINTGIVNITGTNAQTFNLMDGSYTYLAGILNFNGNVSPILNSTASPTFNIVNINNTAGINISTNWLILGAFTINTGARFNTQDHTVEFRNTFTNHGYFSSNGIMYFNPPYDVILTSDGPELSCDGTVIFGGSGKITTVGAATSFNNLTISNTHPAGYTCNMGWYIDGDLVIGNNAIFNAGNYTHTIGGNIYSSGTLNGDVSTFVLTSPTAEITVNETTIFNHLTIHSDATLTPKSDFYVAGNFINNGIIDYANAEGALIMVGANNATLGGTTSPTTIGNITIQKNNEAIVTLATNLSEVGDLYISSGIFNQSTYSISEQNGAGSLTIENGTKLQLGGTNTLPSFTTYDISNESTVEYNGAGTSQSISRTTAYGNLLISNTGTKTAAGSLTVNGNFTLTNGTFVGGNNIHYIRGNWLMNGGSFTNTNTTIFLNGTGTQTISSTGAFNHLTINKSTGILSLFSDITVNGTLTLTNGRLTTDSYKVIISSSGTVTRTNGHVNGTLQKHYNTGNNVSRTFEIGNATVYTPVTVLFSSVTTAGTMTARTTSYDHPELPTSLVNINKSVGRYWTLTNNGIVFPTNGATVTPIWVASDIDAGASYSNFKIKNFDGYTWYMLNNNTPTSTSIAATSVNEFGDFAVGEPMSETYWTGNTSTNWATASNWSNGVPDASTNCLIPAGRSRYPIINETSGEGNVQHITIASGGASLTVSSSTLKVTGSISNNGTFTASSGTINMESSGAQVIAPGTFASNTVGTLIVNNDYSISMGSDLIISSDLTLTKGEFRIGSNTLTLNGSLSYTQGSLLGGNSSNLTIGGSSTTLTLPSVTLNNFILNRVNGANMNGAVTILGNTTLTNGTLTIGANSLSLTNIPTRTSGKLDASNTFSTLILNNTTPGTLPASLFTSTINNLTLNGSGGITASENMTVNGLINLAYNNPSSTKGALDMGNYTLYLGVTSRFIGIGDVTGRMERSNLNSNTVYTFGNPYTSINIPSGGSIPNSVYVKVTIGSYGDWPTEKSTPINRTYEVGMTPPDSGTYPYGNSDVNFSFRYLDTELNNLDESKLVISHYHVNEADSDCYEHGRSSFDSINNYIMMNNMPLYHLVQGESYYPWVTVFSMVEYSPSNVKTWNGAYSSLWNDERNWTPVGIPTNASKVYIPDGNTTNNDPLITDTEINSIIFQPGAYANLGTSTITINGGSGAWNNLSNYVSIGTSTIKFTSPDATISGHNEFYNLIIDDTAILYMMNGSNIKISGSVTNNGTWRTVIGGRTTVEYAGENQTIVVPNSNTSRYDNLILSGTGTKTFPPTPLSIYGNLTLTGEVNTNTEEDLTVKDNLVVGENCNFNLLNNTTTAEKNVTIYGNMDIDEGGNLMLTSNSDLRIEYEGRLTNNGTISGAGYITFVGNDSVMGQLKNNATLTNSGIVRVEKDMLASSGWYFMNFPFDVPETNITDANTGEQLTWGGIKDNDYDFYAGQYNGRGRDMWGYANVLGEGVYWENVPSNEFVKNKGYIIATETDRRIRFSAGNIAQDMFNKETLALEAFKGTTNNWSVHHSWNLMGNPYAVGFNLKNATQDHSPFYFYNGNTYETIMRNDELIINPFTSFFFQAFGSDNAITFNNAGIGFKAANIEGEFDEIGLTINSKNYSDLFRLRIQDIATNSFDKGLDGLKLTSPNTLVPQLYNTYNGTPYSVNAIPMPTSNSTTIPLTVYIPTKGNYTIKFTSPEKIKRFEKVYLTDVTTGSKTDLLSTPEYTFSSNGTGTISTRLKLTLETSANSKVNEINNSDITVVAVENTITISGMSSRGTVKIYDTFGREIRSFTDVSNEEPLTLPVNGIYVVSITTSTQQHKEKVLLKTISKNL